LWSLRFHFFSWWKMLLIMMIFLLFILCLNSSFFPSWSWTSSTLTWVFLIVMRLMIKLQLKVQKQLSSMFFLYNICWLFGLGF
jgi:hypothetical protein